LPGKPAASTEVFEGERRGCTTARHRKLAAAAQRAAKKKKFAEVTTPARKDKNFKYKWTTEV